MLNIQPIKSIKQIPLPTLGETLAFLALVIGMLALMIGFEGMQ